jgi:hypothetical protein
VAGPAGIRPGNCYKYLLGIWIRHSSLSLGKQTDNIGLVLHDDL